MKILKNLLISIFLIVFTIGLSSASYLIYKGYQDLPDVADLVEDYDPIVPTTIYDTNGEIIDKVYIQNRELSSIDEIPIYARNAVMAIEDKRFYKHYGFDPLRLIKSIITAPKYMLQNRNVPGGSTITQQLAKNAFLTMERRLMRKVKEAIIAIEIERKYTKDEILEKYLNEINFGSGSYGIKTAARNFFNKDIKDINLAEAALLAGVPNRPASYSPIKHLSNAIRRQKLVLYQMKKFGFINEKDYKDALAYDIKIERPKRRSYKAPAFTNIVTKKIYEEFGEKEVKEGGLKIYTTLDLKIQKIAEEVFHNSYYLKKNKDLQGAMVMLDSQNGDVKAIIGGKDFKSGNFNRATMAKRLPGSAFKPFIYYTALKRGFPMNIIIEDSKIKFDKWEPQNYDEKFRGNLTMLEGIERSINIVAIKLLNRIKIRNVIKTARAAGITTDIPYNLTIALGTVSLSPFELAKAYIPFSNGGYKVEPLFINKIEDRYGKILYDAHEKKQQKKRVFDSKTISMLVHMMKDVVLYGSGRAANAGIAQAGKTGTTNNFNNAWFSGFTPDFVCTIYIGYDDNKSIGKGKSAAVVAAPIWGAFVKRLIKEGLYKGSEFQFLEDHIKDKTLVYKKIDFYNGLLADKSTIKSRKALFKRGFSPVEKANKYKKGISPFLPEEEEKNNIIEDLIKELLN